MFSRVSYINTMIAFKIIIVILFRIRVIPKIILVNTFFEQWLFFKPNILFCRKDELWCILNLNVMFNYSGLKNKLKWEKIGWFIIWYYIYKRNRIWPLQYVTHLVCIMIFHHGTVFTYIAFCLTYVYYSL